MSLPQVSIDLSVPAIDDLCRIIRNGLKINFEEANVAVVDCPDLTKSPYNLSAAGLSGSPRIVDLGGPGNLLPTIVGTKRYDISSITKQINLPDAFVIGSAAGPYHYVGVNSDMVVDMVTGKNATNASYVCKITENKCQLMTLPRKDFQCSFLLNAFVSKGLPGKVIKITARKRIGKENFVSCIRKSLQKEYKDITIGLGGIFILKSGSVKCHVMPNFSPTPLENDNDVNNWLRFFNMAAPMIFTSVLVSNDPGLNLRIEHSHGYGGGNGGHYHHDVSPDTVEYEAYYNVAEILFRIDQPNYYIGEESSDQPLAMVGRSPESELVCGMHKLFNETIIK